MFRMTSAFSLALTLSGFALMTAAQPVLAGDEHPFVVEFHWRPAAEVTMTRPGDSRDQFQIEIRLNRMAASELPLLLRNLADSTTLQIVRVEMASLEGRSNVAMVTLTSKPVAKDSVGRLLRALKQLVTIDSVTIEMGENDNINTLIDSLLRAFREDSNPAPDPKNIHMELQQAIESALPVLQGKSSWVIEISGFHYLQEDESASDESLNQDSDQ